MSRLQKGAFTLVFSALLLRCCQVSSTNLDIDPINQAVNAADDMLDVSDTEEHRRRGAEDVTPAPVSTRFSLYKSTVCAKCSLRSVQCGCSFGRDNPPFRRLEAFMKAMMEHETRASSRIFQWITVRCSGGFGNQMLQLVTGMLFALATGRGLAVKPDPHSLYEAFDSVIEFPTHEQIKRLNLRERPESFEMNSETIEMFMCGNWELELGQWDVVEVCFGQPPQILLANLLHGDLLRDDFWGRPYFFLSHFFAIGAKVLRQPALVSTRPRHSAWDSAKTVSDLGRILRTSRPKLVIGVHARVHSDFPFEHFDHRPFSASHEGSVNRNSFCVGVMQSLSEMASCVSELTANTAWDAHAAEARPGSVVVLWATDSDDLAAGLRDVVLNISGVVLVQLLHKQPRNPEALISSGLLDLAMLELADVVVGTLASTFSYAAHARSLSMAYYPSFRMNTSSACGSALSTEGGLLSKTTTHDGCNPQDGKIACRQLRAGCLQLLMWDGNPSVCLQDLGSCSDGDMSWAAEYLADADHAEYVAQFNARHGRPLLTPNFREFPSCSEAGGGPTQESAPESGSFWAEQGNSLDSDSGSQYSSTSEPSIGKFARFRELVCEKCATRRRVCGCEQGQETDPFKTLWEYTTAYQRWVKLHQGGTPPKWVLVPAMGGHSNQLLQLVNGLMVAIATGRALAVDWDGRDAGEENHKYEFDSVIEWMTMDDIPEASLGRRKVLGWRRAQLEDVMCGNWELELEQYDVVQICLSQPPQLLLANPLFGAWLNETLRGLPFFFLSHFVWSGDLERRSNVQIETLPSGLAWDGVQELGAFLKRLRASGAGLVVGMHTRIDGFGKEYIFFDHDELEAEDLDDDSQEGRSKAFCYGHPSSLKDFSGCVDWLVLARARTNRRPTPAAVVLGSNDSLVEGAVVVLWATDRDDLSKELLRHVSSKVGVQVVRIAYGQSRRYDTLPWAALMDMVLLEESEVLVGSIGSTFSFAAHARALALPYYPTFRQDRTIACGVPTNTEGGLLSMSTTHDRCKLDHESRMIVCETFRDNCISAIQAGVETEVCIQDIAQCLDGDVSWAESAFVRTRHVRFSSQYWARHGYGMIVNGSTLRPTCPPRFRKDFRADEVAPTWRRFSKYMRSVCTTCAKQSVECGCEQGQETDPFKTLRAYTTAYQRWVKLHQGGTPLKWVLVPVMGGHSNQLLQLVNGLMVAIATGRALAVDWDGRDAGEENHKYEFDSVIEWMTMDDIPEASLGRRKVLGWQRAQLEDVMCGNWELELEQYDVVQICLSQPPQLLLANPLFGAWLNETLRGLPFFFLSHFVWSGDLERRSNVQIETLPSGLAWDGVQELGAFLKRLRASGVGLVVGMHTRIDGFGKEYVFFDHEHALSEPEEGSWGGHCDGDAGSLRDLWGCVERLLEEQWVDGRSKNTGSGAGVGERSGVEGAVVVLLAADRDEMSSEWLRRSARQAGVHVVLLNSGQGQRYGSLPWAALMDMVLLEGAQVMAASFGSSFSFAAEARGMISPLRELHTSHRIVGKRLDTCAEVVERIVAPKKRAGSNTVTGARAPQDVKDRALAGCATIASNTHAGIWVPDPDFCALEPQNHTCLPNSNVRWRPKDTNCDLQFHDAISTCKMLSEKGISNILLAGDSMMRNIFAALSIILTGDYENGAYPLRTHPQKCSGSGQFFSDCKSFISSYDGDKPEKFGWASRIFCGGALNVSLIDNCLAVPSLLDMKNYDVVLWGIGIHNADRWKKLPRFDCMDPNVYAIWIRTVAAAHSCVWLPEWDACIANGPQSSDVCTFTSWVLGDQGELWNSTCDRAGFTSNAFADLVWIPTHIPPAESQWDYPYEFRTFALESWQHLTHWSAAKMHYFDNIGLTAAVPVDSECSTGTHGIHYGPAVNLVKANLLLDLVAKEIRGSKEQVLRPHERGIGNLGTESGAPAVTGHLRFDAYMHSVCTKCLAPHPACKPCEEAASESETLFSVLFAYTKQYDRWRRDYVNGKLAAQQWVVADILSQAPLHEQMAQVIGPLLLALQLGRPLALNSDSQERERFHLYRFFKSVLSWFDLSDVKLVGLPRAQDSLLLSTEEDAIRTLSCASIEELKEFNLIWFRQSVDPQVLSFNTQVRDWLESTFGDTPSFWVSHFLQSGARMQDAPVLIGAVPGDHSWVGRHRLRDVLRKVREQSRMSTVISVYIDSRCPQDPGEEHTPNPSLPDRERVCSMVSACLQAVLRDGAPRGPALVLLGIAAQIEDRKAQLASCVAELTQSTVLFVQREHRPDPHNHQRGANFDMIEAELLGQGTRIIAMQHSSAAFFVHSRARLAPHCLTPHHPDACRPAASSESGRELQNLPMGSCVRPRNTKRHALAVSNRLLGKTERPLLVLVLSPVSVGSTMLLNLVRFLMESQYPAVGNFIHLPGDENHVLEYLDTLKTPAIVKTHSRNIDWWMFTKRRDGSPLVDAIITASRDPAEALCSFFTTQKRTTFPDDWDLFTMLGKMLWIEQFVIKSHGQQALALSLDITEIKKWPRALKIIAMALGVELAPAVLDNILDRMALLRPQALTADAHPITRLQPNHVPEYMGEQIRMYRKQCAARMREVLDELTVEDDSDYVAGMMAEVGTFPPVSKEWVRSWSNQRRSLGDCGSGLGAETMCRVRFMTLPIRLLDTVSSSLVVRCRPHSHLGTLRCSQETKDSLSTSIPHSRREEKCDLRTSGATAEPPSKVAAAPDLLPRRRSAALLDKLLAHHCTPAAQDALARRPVVVDLSCGAGLAALSALAAGCNVLCLEADPSMARDVARTAVQEARDGAIVVVEAEAGSHLAAIEELMEDQRSVRGEQGETGAGQAKAKGQGQRARRMRMESVLDGDVAVVVHERGGGLGRGAVQGLEAWLEAFTFADWIGVRANGEWDRVLRGCKGQGQLYHWAEAVETDAAEAAARGRVVERSPGVQVSSWLEEAPSFDEETVISLPPDRDYLWAHCNQQL